MKKLLVYWVLWWMVMAGGEVFALTANPDFLDLPAGDSAVVTLSGGSGWYKIQSSDEAVATSAYAGDEVTVTAIAKGSAVVTVEDSSGVTVTIPVGVDSPLSANADTVHLNEGDSQTILLKKGVPPYTVSTASPIVTATVNGSVLTITGDAKGTAKVSVTDAVSDSVTIDVEVFLPLAVNTQKILLAENIDATFTVSEGISPYTAVSQDDTIAEASMKKNILTVEGKSSGDTSIVVKDSAVTPTELILPVQVKPFNVSQTVMNINPGGQDSIDIIGTGFFNVTVADPAVATAVISGSKKILLNGLSTGTTVMTVSNSKGDTIDISVDVYDALTVSKTDLVMDDGTTETLKVTGGSWPYDIVAAKPGIVDVPSSWGPLPFDVTAVGEGDTSLIITDLAGASLAVTVTVKPVSLGLGSQTAKVAKGADISIPVFGGTGFYQVAVGDPALVDVKLESGSKLIIDGISLGSTLVSVADSNNDVVDLPVTVILPAVTLDLALTSSTVDLNWNPVSWADEYMLYYTPSDAGGNADLSQISWINLGNVTSVSVDLNVLLTAGFSTGDKYFVAVQAMDSQNPDLAGEISNIADFAIP